MMASVGLHHFDFSAVSDKRNVQFQGGVWLFDHLQIITWNLGVFGSILEKLLCRLKKSNLLSFGESFQLLAGQRFEQ
jgi:hypothetical protein